MRSTRPTTSPTPAAGCGSSLDAKRKLVQKIEGAIGEAFTGVANVDEVLVLINHYPLRNVGWRQSLQSDKPEIVAAVDRLNATAG